MSRDLSDHTYIIFDINSFISISYSGDLIVNRSTLSKFRKLFQQGYHLNKSSISTMSQSCCGLFVIKSPHGHLRFVDADIVYHTIQPIVPALLAIGGISLLTNGKLYLHNFLYTYDSSHQDGLLFDFNNIDTSKILLFSNDGFVINAATNIGCRVIHTYSHAELDKSDLEKLNSCPFRPKNVVFELDVDDTLLNYYFTYLCRKTVLNERVIGFLKERCQMHSDAKVTFNIITSRVAEYEKSPIKYLLIDSVIKKLEKIENLNFKINNIIFVQNLDENGERRIVSTKADNILLRIIEEILTDPSLSENTICVFLDDNTDHIEFAKSMIGVFKLIGISFFPIKIHRFGDLTDEVLESLKQHSILHARTNETQQKTEQGENIDAPAAHPK